MLQNARVTAFTILTEKRTGECGKGVKLPPPPTSPRLGLK